MTKKSVIFGSLAVVSMLPALAFAQELGDVVNLASELGTVVGILIPIAFAAAILFFFWGVAKYILAAGEEEAKAEGRRVMIGGVIGIFVIAAIWGLVAFIGSNLGIGDETTGTVPTINDPVIPIIAP